MNKSREYINYLWQQLIDNKATEAEFDALVSWLERHPEDKFSLEFLENQIAHHQPMDTGDNEYWSEKLKLILRSNPSFGELAVDTQTENIAINMEVDSVNETSVDSAWRISFLRAAWFKYAAVVVIALSIGFHFWPGKEKSMPDAALSKPVPEQNDILPGSDKAILTLSDGRKLELTGQALTISEAGATISIGVGELRYGKTDEVVFNTMSTPRGGQYRLVLPDGSGVWLNAASSITYPTAFTGGSRLVSMTGEAYFEITKDKANPFIVKTNNSEVFVLGTAFNINNYTENSEDGEQTTLVEGSLKISTENKTRILAPGQQALISGDKIALASGVDLEKVLAWKNGEMVLSEITTRKLLQEISRWYDVDIEYRGEVSERKFFGSVSRSVPLSSILSVLGAYGIKTSLDGKKLIIL